MNEKDNGTATPKVGEHFDVLIVGAGISGIGGAYHLTQQSPATSFVVLETFESFGGTWWSHRYPGIRSDSDLHTFGYRFKRCQRRSKTLPFPGGIVGHRSAVEAQEPLRARRGSCASASSFVWMYQSACRALRAFDCLRR